MNTQTDFWRSQAGNDYITRNSPTPAQLSGRVKMWDEILDKMVAPYTVLEVGANVGVNLNVMKRILPPCVHYYALEPNKKACEILQAEAIAHVIINGDASDINLKDGSIDLVFTSGVLIHIKPSNLLRACREIVRVSARYVVAAEYFSVTPMMKEYRGQEDLLWTRDYGAFYLENFPELRPIACGFCWKQLTHLDNLTWWVFEKC